MRIVVDVARCDSHSSCVIEAPDVFDLDDNAIVLVLEEAPGEERRAEVERAAASCPVAAIRVLG